MLGCGMVVKYGPDLLIQESRPYLSPSDKNFLTFWLSDSLINKELKNKRVDVSSMK